MTLSRLHAAHKIAGSLRRRMAITASLAVLLALGASQAMAQSPQDAQAGLLKTANPAGGNVLPAPQYPPAPASAPAAAQPVATPAQQGAVSAPPPGPTDDRAAMQQLFNEQLQAAFPISPQQEQKLLQMNEESARGKARQAPEFSTVMRDIPLDPSAPIPEVEMDLGQPTSISFIDVTGQPWPISDCIYPQGFEGKRPQDVEHSVVVKTTSLVDTGSLVCFLKGLTTQARLILRAGNHKHFLEVDARIPRNGPNARPAPYDLSGAQLVAGDADLSAFLYGVPPAGAQPLEVIGGGVQTKAWLYLGEMWVRTPMVLLSPTPHNQNAREGVYVYSFTKLSSVLNMDDDGHDVQVTVKGVRVLRAQIPQDILTGKSGGGPTLLVKDGGDSPLVMGDHP